MIFLWKPYNQSSYYFCFFRKSEFVMTEIDEIAIAPDAKIGLIKPIMATGIKITLYAKAQNKLSLIVFIVCLDNLIAETTDIKFLLTNVIPAASMATSVPVPHGNTYISRSQCRSIINSVPHQSQPLFPTF